ncbi:MAG: pyridoxamine 5'-phosphate oxidase family protein [Betaproteobacteria bacterium]
MAITHDQGMATLGDLVKDVRVVMFTTREAHGELRSRPMTTQGGDPIDDGALWFFMSRHGDPVAQLEAHPAVNLAYAHPGDDIYVSISGIASVVDDDAKKAALWSPFAKAWFPGGVTDPDLALVKVVIGTAHYWQVKESKFVQLFEIAKAAITGTRPVLGQEGLVGT